MNLKQLTSLFLILSIFIVSCSAPKTQEQEAKKAKYVFFFIGDGMGIAHRSLTENYLSALKDEISTTQLAMTSLPITGVSTTHAATRRITDSAAAGTALATGSKTSVGTLGLSVNHTDTLLPITYFVQKKGYKTGLVTSVSLNHATPAAFYAHVPTRGEYYKIAQQGAASGIDVFAGGGLKHPKGKDNDQKDAYLIFEEAGYTIVRGKNNIEAIAQTSGMFYLENQRLGPSADMPYAVDYNPNDYTLADFTRKSTQLLDNPNGFFLMVEGGKIDWASHSNDAVGVIHDMIDFDNAVAEALKFYQNHPDETLIIVTADHETGGLSLGYTETKYDGELKLLNNQKASIDVISEHINAVYNQNKTITLQQAIEAGKNHYGLDSLSNNEMEKLQKAVTKMNAHQQEQTEYSGVNTIAFALQEILNHRAGVAWTTLSHTANAVPVYAQGAGAEWFSGNYDNVEIPKKIAKAMGIEMK